MKIPTPEYKGPDTGGSTITSVTYKTNDETTQEEQNVSMQKL